MELINNYQVPEGYKQTEIGVIPEDWEYQAIGEAFEIRNNLRLPISKENRQSIQGKYPYYGPTNVQDYIDEYRVEGEHALIGEDGDHFLKWRDLSMTLLVDGKFNVNNHAHIIKGVKNLTAWFYYFFAHRDLTQYLKRQGAGRYKLDKNTLINIPCAIPPLPEQKTIAQTLSDVDVLIATLDQLIAKKRHIKTATMQQLLTGKTRLPGFGEGKGYTKSAIGLIPEDWLCLEFIQIVHSYIDYRGRTPRKLGMSWGGGNILALSANNVLMGKIDPNKEAYFASEELYRKWMQQGECEQGDILLTMEAPLGNVAQIPDSSKYILSQRVLLIKTKEWIDKNFVLHYLQGEFFQGQLSINATGSTAKGIQRKKLDKISIYTPRKTEEQKAIAQVLSDINTQITALEKRRAKTQAIKQGMMQELLTGKTRIINN